MTTPRVYTQFDLMLEFMKDKPPGPFILLSDHKEVVKRLEDEQVQHIELLGEGYDKTIKRQALAIEKLKEQRNWNCILETNCSAGQNTELIERYDSEIAAILQEAK